ncbi:putative mycolyltransferase [Gordonia effusa NBRC 100432]|uniref:Putative mycolyltransferase n=1 Tax=Gordonia effusa NBRC 100432 TaxID=1077974 RepID=H0R371_9ACTN|nr:putative mycolyltransferase [Gordonia effusa NBRC 100432]
MPSHYPSPLRARRRRAFGIVVAGLAIVLSAVTITVVGAGHGDAATRQRFYVSGCGMPTSPVDMWTRGGNYKTAIALDGLRATTDMSGWRHNTRIQKMADHGVNVIEPVGGLGSFYTNWDKKSKLSKVKYRYMWTCRLDTIVRELDARGLAVGKWGKYALMGISMGGNAAMIYAVNHRKRFSHAFSMSGYLNLSAPSMREGIRAALVDAGVQAGVGPLDADAMWGPPWSKRWLDNDPFLQTQRMKGMKLRIGASTGLWGVHDREPVSAVKGTPLELLALAQTRAFEVSALRAGVDVSSDYPTQGTHDWGYWNDMVWRAKNSGWFRDR